MVRTRIVSLLRVIFPLAALALLSTLFLFGAQTETDDRLPYSNVTPEDLAQRPVVTSPSYAGVAADGTQIEMTADLANPQDQDGRSEASGIHLTLRSDDGLVSDLVAAQGVLQGPEIHLQGDVQMNTSNGWTMVSDEFTARTDDGTLRADQQVDVTAPFGTMTAGGMQLYRSDQDENNHVLDLNGGVRMIYLP